jgi:tetratricopeptide (TPR) repeat protein
MSVEDIVGKAISNYRTAIKTAYGNPNLLSCMKQSDIDVFLKQAYPLVIKFYESALKTVLDINKEGALDDFLMNFAEVGAKENLKPHLHIIRLFNADISNWDYSFPLEEYLDLMSAKKLHLLTAAGIDKFENNFDEYEKARLKNGHDIIGEDYLEWGCYDYALDYFREKLKVEPSRDLVKALQTFYRDLIKPTIERINQAKEKAKEENALGKNIDNVSEKDEIF